MQATEILLIPNKTEILKLGVMKLMSETIVMEGKDRFKTVKYEPICFYGNYDCINDPAYIQATYPERYKKFYDNTCVFCNMERYYERI